jgi:hypothetical protein
MAGKGVVATSAPIEIHRDRRAGDGDAEREGAQAERRKQQDPAPAQRTRAYHHQHRNEEIELLLHRQRPGVQQRLEGAHRGEVVAGYPPEVDVGHRRRRGHQGPGHGDQIGRQQQGGRCDRGDDQSDEQRGGNAADAPVVEASDRHLPRFDVAGQLPRDEKARDDEEHVDPDEAAGKPRHAAMEQQHSQNRDGAQTVDVGAIGARMDARRRFGIVCGLQYRPGFPGAEVGRTPRWSGRLARRVETAKLRRPGGVAANQQFHIRLMLAASGMICSRDRPLRVRGRADHTDVGHGAPMVW